MPTINNEASASIEKRNHIIQEAQDSSSSEIEIAKIETIKNKDSIADIFGSSSLESLYNDDVFLNDSELVKDIKRFRKVNTYLDPNIKLRHDKITFLRIVEEKDDNSVKEKFNRYLNVKYNHITNPLSFNENMDRFVRQSKIVSEFIEDIITIGKFTENEKKVLSENRELKSNPNILNLLKLYRNTENERLQFEILRKIGLVDLVYRIEKNFPLEYTEYVTNEVEKLFSIGLSLKKTERKTCYIWLDENDKAKYNFSEASAMKEYSNNCVLREKKGLAKCALEQKTYTSYNTNSGELAILQLRDKLRKDGRAYYTSFLEKMVRKNVEFPTQIHDTIGVRLVVENPDDIQRYILALEKFIGGSSSRKKEKDTIHKFGRKRLSPYSSKDYYVWKAVYDIALPHFTIKYFKELKKIAQNKRTIEIINRRIEHMVKNPINAVVEVQLQDFDSYILSVVKDSPADHSRLKMNQVRKNSFYKIFPKEIYKKEFE